MEYSQYRSFWLKILVACRNIPRIDSNLMRPIILYYEIILISLVRRQQPSDHLVIYCCLSNFFPHPLHFYSPSHRFLKTLLTWKNPPHHIPPDLLQWRPHFPHLVASPPTPDPLHRCPRPPYWIYFIYVYIHHTGSTISAPSIHLKWSILWYRCSTHWYARDHHTRMPSRRSRIPQHFVVLLPASSTTFIIFGFFIAFLRH